MGAVAACKLPAVANGKWQMADVCTAQVDETHFAGRGNMRRPRMST